MEITTSHKPLSALGRHHALQADLGSELGVAGKALLGVKGLATSKAEASHGLRAARDLVFLGTIEDPFRSG